MLYRPVYMRGGLHGDELIAAIKRVCALGPSKLARAARKAPAAAVRRAAVKRLRDMELLARIAYGDLDQFVRMDAIERLDGLSRENADYGADAVSRANSAHFERVCGILGGFGKALGAAVRLVKKIRGSDREKYGIPVQMLFADIARNDPDGSVRMAAAGRLNDRKLLSAIARSDPEEYVREAARRRLGTK